MRVVQFETPEHGRRVGMVIGNEVCDLTSAVPAWSRVIDVFHAARQSSRNFSETVTDALEAERLERLHYSELLVAEPHGGQPWLCAPVDHADEHRVLISGTGLTHTGGMKSRDQMHSSDTAATVPQTDSARMFQIGIDGGNPSAGVRGAAPEWFYKGNGYNLRGPNSALEIPEFALDGGEEPEVAAVYVIGDDGVPYRLGFCLGNEWSDHPFEKLNYLYLAPSKLRCCAIGPELVTDISFSSLDLRCTVRRGAQTIYDSGPLLSGEQNMCHSLANCEDHHFKFPQHRRPGDVHVHFFGTSKLSFSERDWKYQDGDVVTVVGDQFGAPLVNPICCMQGNGGIVSAIPMN